MREALLYKKLDNNAVRCQTCGHECAIAQGRTGVCGVRQNIKGKLYLLAFGQAAAINVDPIEKKPLFHFLPGSKAFSFGTLGCNFQCLNCHNYDISQMYAPLEVLGRKIENFSAPENKVKTKTIHISENDPINKSGRLLTGYGYKGRVAAYKELDWGYQAEPQDLVEQAMANKCESIAYTYNEPTIFLEYALETMKLARRAGLKNVWVSNGYMSRKTLDLVIPCLDAINVDIKSFDEPFYQKNCGAKLAPVLENCKRLVKQGVWLEITTLVIPTLSDNEAMLGAVARFIRQELGDFVPWHVSAFSGAISWKLQHLPDTSVLTIKRTYEIGKKEGLKYVYAGNVWDDNLENTYCPKCGAVVVERQGYAVKQHDKNGVCPACKEKIAGRF